METMVEQRKAERTAVKWPVSLWLPQAHRFFNGRSANISRTGAYVAVPLTTPVQKGHCVEVNFPRSSALAQQKGSYARIKKGKVVRVDRTELLRQGKLGVAVHFEDNE